MIEKLTSDELNKVVENFFAIQEMFAEEVKSVYPNEHFEKCVIIDCRDYHWEISDIETMGRITTHNTVWIRLFKEKGNLIREVSRKDFIVCDLSELVKRVGSYALIFKMYGEYPEIYVFYSAKEIKE